MYKYTYIHLYAHERFGGGNILNKAIDKIKLN